MTVSRLGPAVFALLAAALVAAPASAETARYWQVDPARSWIEFAGEVGGVPFTGRFERFEAWIRFDPQTPEGGRADVRIDAASVESGNGDRDSALKGPDFFSVGVWPQARWRTASIEATGSGFEAAGLLEARDASAFVPLAFTVSGQNGGFVLDGTAAVSRLELGLGTSADWSDTEWIRENIEISVHVESCGQIEVAGDELPDAALLRCD